MDFKTVAEKVLVARDSQYKVSESARHKFLQELARNLDEERSGIFKANRKDLKKLDPSDHLYDRLELNDKRVGSIIESVLYIDQLPYVVGKEVSHHVNSSGLDISKILVPFGVIGMIYEARPNVTVDVAALCIYSGNCCVLRGGSAADESNKFLVHNVIRPALISAGIDENSVCLLDSDRKYVGEMLSASDVIDLVIPRGGQDLIDMVREKASMPVIETGRGVCHIYAHSDCDLDMATNIVVNAKVSRPSVCNSLDTALISREVASDLLVILGAELAQFNVEIYADEESYELLHGNYPDHILFKASGSNFGEEYLRLAMSIKIVDGLDEAVSHISEFSSKHSEGIVCGDREIASEFLARVDAASVYHNASIRFSDGFEYGLGAEIGVSTQKLHARGPFGIEEIMTYKWICKGDGIVRG